MKRVYTSPMMVGEMYDTNAYCGACTSNPQFDAGKLIVDQSGSWSVNPSRLESMGYDTSHTFEQSSRRNQKSYASNAGGQQQYYWTCNCTDHPGDVYYLEYSAGRTEWNRKDTFVLFVEREESKSANALDVHWSNIPMPQTEFNYNGSAGRYVTDMALSTVTFSNPMVADS